MRILLQRLNTNQLGSIVLFVENFLESPITKILLHLAIGEIHYVGPVLLSERSSQVQRKSQESQRLGLCLLYFHFSANLQPDHQINFSTLLEVLAHDEFHTMGVLWGSTVPTKSKGFV